MREVGQEKDLTLELIKEIRDMKEYLKILSLPVIEKGLSKYFSGHKQFQAYMLLDGSLSAPKISNHIGVHENTIKNWLKKWLTTFGIVEKVGKQGKFNKKYTIYELIIMGNDGWVFKDDSMEESNNE